jgi:hypothetical protein
MAVNSRAIPSLSKSGSFAGLHLTIIDDIAGLPVRLISTLIPSSHLWGSSLFSVQGNLTVIE